MRRPALTLLILSTVLAPAGAMVGGAPPAGDLGRSVVMIVGSRGSSCSGVALARDVILTAGHCVMPGADHKIVTFAGDGQPSLTDIATIARHPAFDANAALRHRVTADVALLKLPAPLSLVTIPLAAATRAAVGDRFVVVGYGLTEPGNGRSGGTVRSATLVATGQPGTLQIRLVDPATKGERPGLGACTGDSGAPVFRAEQGRFAVAGVVSWSTGPKMSDGCGGMTGVTPLMRYRDWVVEIMRKLDAETK